jgi:hypothetical protein
VVRRNIRPVDTLSIGNSQLKDSKDRIWICEVRDEVIQKGSFAVVSPIGSIDDSGMPARAMRVSETVEATDPNGPPSATESTVSKKSSTGEA